ncbi:MAG: segregation/condensation protein A [Chloroflexi bacterium]|nr:segregation/condensation protein A [Chloroflexota bacterium]
MSAVPLAGDRAAPRQLRLQLETFEGPLDLLLTLIEARRLPITGISLAQVADQYLEQVHALPHLDPELLSEFLQIGGKLLLLKSRALLLVDEPDPVLEETADELERRLAEYGVFRAAAQQLQALEARGLRTYPTSREPRVDLGPGPLTPITAAQLAAVWRRLLREPLPVIADLPVLARASVEAKRSLILDLLRTRGALDFRAVAGDTVDELVAGFLAVLELFRRGLIGVEQSAPFRELRLLPVPTPPDKRR